ncbi:MAG: phosphatidate cytidylyltransferase [Deltaproteobacteria bacterium]|nr:phosphatidate cytidylyltransferase [Deltaproteobacteria bacterium]
MKRVITALFLVPAVVFIVLYTAAIWLLLSVILITLIALAEYNRLSAVKPGDRLSDFLVLLFGAATPILFFAGASSYVPALAMMAAFAFFALGMIRSSEFKAVFLNTAVRTFGVIYIALPFSYFILLRGMENGGRWILLLFTVIWANDTFAMLAGKTIGKHKLSPMISPGKTVEGAVGGLVGGGVAALLYNNFLSMGLGPGSILLLAAVIGIVGIFGDLFESVIKRAAGEKDSGTIIPGHGGMLDRVDSLVFAVPLLYYYLTIGRFL